MATLTLPALTLPDPTVSGEGALDPLGLANFGDRLAEEMIPGVRARQNRVRYLTAVAVGASVVEGLDDLVSADGSTTPQLAFEWLLVEGLVRAAEPESYRGTAGSFKARDAIERKVPMSAKTYLKTPSVFGFHGIYKTLAEELQIVDRDMRLMEKGWDVVDAWEREQGLAGFLDRASTLNGKGGWKERLRAAVETALAKGYSDESASWAGWRFFATHLGPSSMGKREAAVLYRLLTQEDGGTRTEVMQRLRNAPQGDHADDELTRSILAPVASVELKRRLEAIESYERFCAIIEFAFDSICYAARDPKSPASPAHFLPESQARALVAELPETIRRTERALESFEVPLQTAFHDIALEFDVTKSVDELFQAILSRHHTVQSRKPPDGKRDWFERTTGGGAIVRPPYRLTKAPERDSGWGRPYRLEACLRFTRDLERAGHGRP